jgi:hypothetical protein
MGWLGVISCIIGASFFGLIAGVYSVVAIGIFSGTMSNIDFGPVILPSIDPFLKYLFSFLTVTTGLILALFLAFPFSLLGFFGFKLARKVTKESIKEVAAGWSILVVPLVLPSHHIFSFQRELV